MSPWREVTNPMNGEIQTHVKEVWYNSFITVTLRWQVLPQNLRLICYNSAVSKNPKQASLTMEGMEIVQIP